MKSVITAEKSALPKQASPQDPPIEQSATAATFPLSFAQQRLWFLDQLEPNSPLYNIPVAARLTGKLDVSALEQSLAAIVQRHEALRTRFVCQDAGPVQIVEDAKDFKLQLVQLNENSSSQRERAAQQWMENEARRPFDLTKQLLLRASLLSLDAETHVLVLVFHHIVADEWSLKAFWRELGTLYQGFEEGKPVTLPELPVQYSDYTLWQRDWLQGEALDRLLNFWKRKLSGAPPGLELPGDRPRRLNPSFRGNSKRRTLGKAVSRKVKELADQEQATVFMVLLAAFKALLHRYTQQDDLVLASPMAGRSQVELEPLIGFFVNTLPLRTDLSRNPSFRELLRRVREVALDAQQYQDLPFEKLVEELQPERSLEHMPFSRVVFAVQNQVLEELQWPGLTGRLLELNTGTAKFDLTLVLLETAEGLVAHAEYSRDLFNDSTIERLLEHFENLLTGATQNPETRLAELPLLSQDETRQLLEEWNRTQSDYPHDKCIHEIFEQVASQNPNSVAVKFPGSSLTYVELNARANQLARHLRKHELGAETPIGICSERSVEMVIGILAILKAGCAYVPLDPANPPERLGFMLEDARTPVLLTQQHLLNHLQPGLPSAVKCFCLDSDWKSSAVESTENLNNTSKVDALAYVMYTSGSTGRPKGVAVPHRAVNRLVLDTNYISFGQDDRVAQVSNISFDAATFEIWGALLNGGQLVGINRDIALSPAEFARQLQEQGITAMFLTSALFNQLVAAVPGALRTVRTVIAGGEALDPKFVRKALREGPPQRLLNGYGPTENTTFTCCHLVREVPEDATSIPIGKPIANTQVYILDSHLQPVPVGVPGELYAGGDGVARGYWNRPELTAERFVPNPFSKNKVARLYRTGDLARWLPDGTIEFLGRSDQQVKLRGFRIETGEIEAALSEHPGIRQCAVTLWGKESDEKRLVAYFTSAFAPRPNSSELREFLCRKLPEYMVPAAFIALDSLPLNANGKVDRKALPAPEGLRPELERKYVAPSDELETRLAQIWEQVLGVQPIGVSDKFFDLGGHSLLAVRLILEIEKSFGRKLRLATIFQAPTVKQLAEILREEVAESSATNGSLVEIQGKGTKAPLFLVHGAGGGMFWGYANLAHDLGPDVPVYGFKARGLAGREEFESIEDMAAEYLADLQTIQPHGPYRLGGYCFGGNVAFEMACQLQSKGETVSLLALVNSAPPNSSYLKIPWTPIWWLRFARNMVYALKYFFQWTGPQRRGFFKWKWSKLRRKLGLRSKSPDSLSGVNAGDLVDLSKFTPEEKRTWEAHIKALVKFQPHRFNGEVHLFRSAGHPLWCSYDPAYGWGDFAKQGVEITVIPAFHEKIMEEPHVSTMAQHLRKLLSGEPGPALEPLQRENQNEPAQPELTETHKRLLLGDWANTAQDYPKHKTLVDLFEEQVARTPDAKALVFGETRLTYRELHAKAAAIAGRLNDLRVGNESLVGVCLERSWEMVTGLLGVLQAGAAYLPLDPAYPAERLAYMLEDSGAPVLLTQKKLLPSLPKTRATVLCIEDVLASAQMEHEADLNQRHLSPIDSRTNLRPNHLAYVIYTSGSTGKPKGVALEHRSVVAFVCWARSIFTDEELSGVLAATSMCFDVSVFEMFVPLCWGGKIIVAENALALPSIRASKEVRMAAMVPSAIRELLRVKSVPDSLQVVCLAGEALSAELSDQIYRESSVKKVYDLYGPTETTTYSTFALRRPGGPATIGKPLANEQVYLLDSNRRLVPLGVNGELYIGGDGLARGYLNQPQLTAEKFVPHPFKEDARLYRTGDLARWRPDGNLEFLGRIDHQVKIRGFRVELGEIEKNLKSQVETGEVVVVAREDQPGDKRLVAYIAGTDEALTAAALKSALRKTLPDYMVPSAFVFLDAMPRTPNGKLDRKGLPAPQFEREARELVRPRTPTEQQLVAIWCEVLRLKEVGVTDNFFELGGHSLLAIQINSRIRELFKVDLPLFSLFDAPTIAQLAAGLDANQWKKLKGDETVALRRMPRGTKVPTSSVQSRLWFLDQLHPGSPAYNVPAAFRLKGDLDIQALENSFNEVVRRHETLRTIFKEVDGELTQIIRPSQKMNLEVVDLSTRVAREDRAVKLSLSSLGERPEEEANIQSALSLEPVKAWAEKEAQKPFDLAKGPLLRGSLGRIANDEHVLLVVMHHTISDGWSLGILFKELSRLYEALALGKPAPQLPELPVQYADFAFWQQHRLSTQEPTQDLEYWTAKLAGTPEQTELPKDLNVLNDASAGTCTLALGTVLSRELSGFCQREGSTPFGLFMTALALTLKGWTQQNDLVLGTVVAGRNRREFENLIGCFMNFLPIRVGLEHAKASTGRDVLRQLRSTVLEAQAHEECPFEKIVAASRTRRKIDQNPLYNVGLLLQNFEGSSFGAPGIQALPMRVSTGSALLDLRFVVEQSSAGFELECEFKRGLFKTSTAEQLLASFRDILKTLIGNPDTKVDEFKLTPALVEQSEAARANKRQQRIALAASFTAEPIADSLQFWNQELNLHFDVEFAPYNQIFQELLDPASLLAGNKDGLNVILLRLEDWQRNNELPSRIAQQENVERNAREFLAAIKSAAGRNSTPYLVCICPPKPSTVADVNQAAFLAQVEHMLQSELENQTGVYCVGTKELNELYPVADYYDQNAEELGHVPYTPAFFAGVGTLVVRKFHALNRLGRKVIVLDCDQTLWSGVCGEDGAKGICLDDPRKALQQFMRAQQETGVLLCLCSKNNEADVREVFSQRLDMPLRSEHITGWRLNWQPKSENLKSLAKELELGLDSFIFIDDNPVECAEVEANCPEVLTLLLPEDPELLPQFLKHCWVFDRLKLTSEDRRRTEMYRQNRERQALRAQAPSLADFIASLDLHVQCEILSASHTSRASQLTHRTNQFNCTTRRYSEAELQKMLNDFKAMAVSVSDRFGDYGMVGLMIFQEQAPSLDVDTFLLSCRVLGRGVEHRMLSELGKLAQERGLQWVDVHYVKTEKNKPALDFLTAVGSQFQQPLNGGYVFRFPVQYAAELVFAPAANSEGSQTGNDSTARAKTETGLAGREKPFPCRRIALESNDAVAIHRRLETQAGTRSANQKNYVAPRTEKERELCALWQKLLRVTRVGVRDNFFELGGHSLLAVRLFAELERMTGRKSPLVTIFQSPTVEELAHALERTQPAGQSELLVPLQPQGNKPPLILVHGAGGDVLWGYAKLAAHLPPDQPLYGIRSCGQAKLQEPATLEEMANRYLEELEHLQPKGPYYLGGYCFGGNVAYEMARQLRARGEEVAMVLLLDSAPANAGYERITWWRPAFSWAFLRNLSYWLSDFARSSSEEKRRYLTRKFRWLGRKLKQFVTRGISRADIDVEQIVDPIYFSPAELELWRIHLQALTDHVEGTYPGKVILLRTRGQPLFCSFADDFCWGRLAKGGVEIHRLPGAHENIFMEPNVKYLAAQVQACLDGVTSNHNPTPVILNH